MTRLKGFLRSLSSRPERALARSETTRGAERPCVLRDYNNIRTAIAAVVKIVLSTLREIFDESAYARFLERAKLQSSREAYAAFCRERETAKNRVHRCC
jgi:hypothetical protein